MIAGSLFNIAFSSIMANKLRAGLTFLGVIFGVTSVMTIMSALEGMMGAIEADLASLGPTTFIVERIGVAMSDEEFFEKLKRKPMKGEYSQAIRDQCVLVDKVCAGTGSRARVKVGNNAMRRVRIRAGEPSYIDIVDMRVAQGRFFSWEDQLYRRKVAFIGDKIRETLFPDVDPLGKDVKIDGQKYTVIGVAKKQGGVFGGDNEDVFIGIPLSTFNKQFGEPRYGYTLYVKAMSVEVLPEAMDEVRGVLRSMRHVSYNKEDDFDMLTADNILDLVNQITKMFRMALIGISSISLVVGGIVVMNIMMVSVTERTREIGIRKSLGAKRIHIMAQFLFESVIITLSGGLIGIGLGFAIARVLMQQIDMVISPSAMAIFSGLFISTSVGLFFGIYPAMKAARLDPVKALSYE